MLRHKILPWKIYPASRNNSKTPAGPQEETGKVKVKGDGNFERNWIRKGKEGKEKRGEKVDDEERKNRNYLRETRISFLGPDSGL